ncbi:MAG TPA: hypothetical protein VN256_09790 [Pyrinomonadaceae bacterium]|nr:hypothetical protein [Pyrinomonadaceae bacterium]
MNAVSEIVGRADKGTAVYRALRPLLCATCGAGINEGALFTRRKVKGIGVRIMPQCRECAPFTFEPGAKKESDLLRSLLAEPAASPPKRPAPEKNINEEVARRLGPALRRKKERQ